MPAPDAAVATRPDCDLAALRRIGRTDILRAGDRRQLCSPALPLGKTASARRDLRAKGYLGSGCPGQRGPRFFMDSLFRHCTEPRRSLDHQHGQRRRRRGGAGWKY